jgi:hypothetical protein
MREISTAKTFVQLCDVQPQHRLELRKAVVSWSCGLIKDGEPLSLVRKRKKIRISLSGILPGSNRKIDGY